MRPLLVTSLLLTTAALVRADGAEAFSAVRTAQRVASTGSLVEVTGERGEPQPGQWTLLYSDPQARGGVLEVVVANDAVLSQRTPLRGYTGLTAQPTIRIAKLNFDSGSAFSVAEHQAKNKGIGFNWVDYKLRVEPTTGAAVWGLRLYDNMGAEVGYLEVSAEDGSLVTPLQPGVARNDEETRQFSDSSTGKKMGGVIGAVGGFLNTTANKVKNTTLRTVGTVQEVLTGDRTIGPKDDENGN